MECVHAYARAVDEVFRRLFAARITSLGRSHAISLIALGGYGRGELFPWSDVDIMLLYAQRADTGIIRAFERDAWDIGLALGFVARNAGGMRSNSR